MMNSTASYKPKRNENIHQHKNLYMNIHISILHDGKK